MQFTYRVTVTREIVDATNSSSYFIVHCLDKNPLYLSMHEVTSLFSGTPILLLSYANGSVKARCSVPQVLYFIYTFKYRNYAVVADL